MNSGPLPLLFLGLTLGLALSRVPRGLAWRSLLVVIVSALIASFVPVSADLSVKVEVGLWISTILIGVAMFVPGRLVVRLAYVLALVAGLFLGLVASLSTGLLLLLPALLVVLVFIPLQAFSSKGSAIAAKVIASWMIAIGTLVLFASMVPTPGYRQDHME